MEASRRIQVLKRLPFSSTTQSLKSLEKAFKDYFNKKQPLKKFPRFKKKFQSTSFKFPKGFKIEKNQVYLLKIGWLSFRKSRAIQGKSKNITVSLKARYW